MGFLGAYFLFLSVLFHELTHSYIAKREGIEVKEITLFIFGGVSQLTKEPEDPKKELRIYLYRERPDLSERLCDDVFLEAMESDGEPAWRRQLMYRAVRLFGRRG